MIRNTQSRSGFTLVEILVAMGLTIFILTIMAEAFIAGADMFRGLKAVGDLNQSLRTATNIMGSDLAADHFDGKRRLSDKGFWTDPYKGPPLQGYFYIEQNPTPYNPAQNYFWSFPVIEGTDLDGLPVRRCTAHKMAFTVKARGNSPQNFYAAQVPQIPGLPVNPLLPFANTGSPDGRYQLGGTFSSQWVEVSYFLAPNGFFTPANPQTGTPALQLYGLYRQQRLVLPSTKDPVTGLDINWTAGLITGSPLQGIPLIVGPNNTLAIYGGKFSVNVNPATSTPPVVLPLAQQTLYFNNPADLTIPERRASAKFRTRSTLPFGATFNPISDTSGNLTGEDILLTNVLSFEITALMSYAQNPSDFYDLPPPVPPAGVTLPQLPAYYSNLGYLLPNQNQLPWPPANGPGYFDTWSSRRDDFYNYMGAPIPTTAPTPYTIQALKITLRIYDESTQTTRQVTLIQEM
jgi:type II secretory pathway pseudopilin PulG